jgi:hypothetical protein
LLAGPEQIDTKRTGHNSPLLYYYPLPNAIADLASTVGNEMPYPSSMLLMGTTRGSRSLSSGSQPIAGPSQQNAKIANQSSKDTSPSLYYYHPSVLLAVVGAIAFAVVLAIYLWRFTQSQAWYFWAMYIGLLCKIALI